MDARPAALHTLAPVAGSVDAGQPFLLCETVGFSVVLALKSVMV